jgi:predicted alpha/beta superfamily hydrolase
MTGWHDYPGETATPDAHTVAGRLRVWNGFHSPQLKNRRDIWVYLPPSAAAGGRRYPVLYMQDGQNLFDRALIPDGEWQVDETIEALSGEGIEAIVAGIAHIPAARSVEYAPHAWGEDYLAFVVETLKPVIDADFPTRPEREHTGILGSSYGAQISLYGFFRYPDVFGKAGAFSPAWWRDRRKTWAFLRDAPFAPGRVYIDTGTAETAVDPEGYVRDARRLRDLIEAKGYVRDRDLLYVEEEGGIHHETAWARRLPAALRFLLGPSQSA